MIAASFQIPNWAITLPLGEHRKKFSLGTGVTTLPLHHIQLENTFHSLPKCKVFSECHPCQASPELSKQPLVTGRGRHLLQWFPASVGIPQVWHMHMDVICENIYTWNSAFVPVPTRPWKVHSVHISCTGRRHTAFVICCRFLCIAKGTSKADCKQCAFAGIKSHVITVPCDLVKCIFTVLLLLCSDAFWIGCKISLHGKYTEMRGFEPTFSCTIQVWRALKM